MEEHFDGAAKAFATEVPRRQALRRIGLGAGAAMAALVFPGSAQAASKACPPSKGGTPCSGPGGTFTCCPQGTFCCNGKCCPINGTCCAGICCGAGSSCCGSTCCEAGRVCCGSTCCPNGQICAEVGALGAKACVPVPF